MSSLLIPWNEQPSALLISRRGPRKAIASLLSAAPLDLRASVLLDCYQR